MAIVAGYIGLCLSLISSPDKRWKWAVRFG